MPASAAAQDSPATKRLKARFPEYEKQITQVASNVYVAVGDRRDKTKRGSYHLVLLAKNEEGYKNLKYLVSMGFVEGFYYSPRIDKELLKQHSGGLIGSSACLGTRALEERPSSGARHPGVGEVAHRARAAPTFGSSLRPTARTALPRWGSRRARAASTPGSARSPQVMI